MKKLIKLLMLGVIGFLVQPCLQAVTPDEMFFRDGNDTIIIDLPNQSQVIIVVENLSQLREMGKISVDSILAEVARQLDQQAMYPGDTVMDFYLDDRSELRSNRPTILEHDGGTDRNSPSEDPGLRMNFGFNIGGGLIRNVLSPGIAAKIALESGKNSFGAGVQSQYFFEQTEGKWSTHINTFVTATYGRTVAREGNAATHHEVTLGYLVGESGGYFGENTFVLSYGNDKMKLQPQLYFTDNFRSVFPGIALMF